MASRPGLPSVLALVWLVGDGSAHAQAPTHFATLSVPPPSVGTCMPARAPAAAAPNAETLQGRRLVMTARAPRARREITVYLDARGQLRRYHETVSRGTGAASSVGEAIIAGVAGSGPMRGFSLRTNVAMDPLPRGVRPTAAALEAMRERARTERSRVPLSGTELARVREVAAWLVTRCPA